MVECEWSLFFNASREQKSFNRYMVECESLAVGVLKRGGIVLIDTWWNVNAEDCHTLILTDTVLIDTWWNVNI